MAGKLVAASNQGFDPGYRLLRGPVTADDTLLTGAQMNRSLNQLLAASTVGYAIHTAHLDGIRVGVFGQAADAKTAVLTIYGWKTRLTHGSLVAQLTATLGAAVSQDINNASPGWHTEELLDQSVRDAMSKDEDWYACDEYAAPTLDPGDAITIPDQNSIGGEIYPLWFEVDLARTQYGAMALFVTGLAGQMTKVVALYSPLNVKLGLSKTSFL